MATSLASSIPARLSSGLSTAISSLSRLLSLRLGSAINRFDMVFSTFMPRRRVAVIAATVTALCLFLLWFPLPEPRNIVPGTGSLVPGEPAAPAAGGDDEGKGKSKSDQDDHAQLSVPPEYGYVPPQSEYCETRFSTKFLELLKNRTDQYCTNESRSRLNCFHITTNSKGNVDSLCIGQGAVIDAESKKFSLDCQERSSVDSDATAAIGVPLGKFPNYWYETGPRYIFDNFIDLGASEKVREMPAAADSDSRNFTLLLKREGHANTWHSLMEIMTMMLTFDVLRMAPDPARPGQAYYSFPEDMANTQVVVLDHTDEGPYYDLWRFASDHPVLRLSDFIAQSKSTPALLDHIIIPMAGAANPQWQNDWTVEPCSSGQLLETFSKRVLDFYKIQKDPTDPSADSAIAVTFIDRKHRRLKDQESLLDSLRQKFNGQHVTIQAVDLAAIPFKEQLQVVRDTDVLVGVHGAGLTHELFLRKGSAVVEILPPDLDHKGFRNMANMLGHDYFSVHAGGSKKKDARGEEEDKSVLRRNKFDRRPPAPRTPEEEDGFGSIKKRDWHDEDVSLDSARFVDVVGVAIHAMYNKGLRSFDIN